MKHLKYLSYVMRHKWFVFIECCKLKIPWRGITHDFSKFLPSELFSYAEYFYGKYGFKFNGGFMWEFKEKQQVESKFNISWLKHQKRNPHHWQYWVLINDGDSTVALPIPDKYRREMLANWNGARMTRADGAQKTTKDWYLLNKNNMIFHPETRKWLEKILGVNA